MRLYKLNFNFVQNRLFYNDNLQFTIYSLQCCISKQDASFTVSWQIRRKMTIGGCRCSCSSSCGIQLRVVAQRNRYFDKEMLIIIVACKIEIERGRVREREREMMKSWVWPEGETWGLILFLRVLFSSKSTFRFTLTKICWQAGSKKLQRTEKGNLF